MPNENPAYIEWFRDINDLQTSDGENVQVISFDHVNDEGAINEWAHQFRINYETDAELEASCETTGLSQEEYLRTIKLPSQGSTRAGDFAELLVGDYLSFLLGYTVPRIKYDRRENPNVPTSGVDMIAFKVYEDDDQNEDELLTCEVKSRFSRGGNTFQIAVDDSQKDFETRLPFSLNAVRLRMLERNEIQTARKVARFQNKTASHYRKITSAALVCSNDQWDESLITTATGEHLNPNKFYFVFRGEDFMSLVHRLYQAAYVAN